MRSSSPIAPGRRKPCRTTSKRTRASRYAEVALCYGAREADAQETAHRYFRWSLTGWPVQAELPDTEGFAAASKHVTPEVVARSVSCGPAPERHLEAIDRFIQAGYDHLILLQVGPDQESVFDLFERELAPALRERTAG